jgi:DNA excision repair protein ERCC-2
VWTVSVRELCEFTARRGSLDQRFTPSATATEGLLGQQWVALRRGEDHETEISLQEQVGNVVVRGRADGYSPGTRCLEEVKTSRVAPEGLAEHKQALHWAQLRTYGALFVKARQLDEIHLRLVYVDADTQTETHLDEACRASELRLEFEARCESFRAWAAQEATHRLARDTALADLRFPMPDFRPGQRDLAEAVWRTHAAGRTLLAQAPTGIGKTLGVLYPTLRALPRTQADRAVYVTCKGTGRSPALQALQRIQAVLAQGSASQDLPNPAALAERPAVPVRLRVMDVSSKEQACVNPERACHGEDCPLALGFYDRLPAARAVAVDQGWLDRETLRDIALAHQVCPYYLGQDLMRWMDVLLCDAFHVFDFGGSVWGLSQALGWRTLVVVDEAHNLIERCRDLYSAELNRQRLRQAAALAPQALRRRFERLLVHLDRLAESPPDSPVLPEWPDALHKDLQALSAGLGDWLLRHPLTTGELPRLHVELALLNRLAQEVGDHALVECQTEAGAFPGGNSLPGLSSAATLNDDSDGVESTTSVDAEAMKLGEPMALLPGMDDEPHHRADLTLRLRNLVPARYLRGRWTQFHSTVLFSATLGTRDYQRQLLGLPDNVAWLDVAPIFPAEHLQVQVARHLSTRWRHRDASLAAVMAVMVRQFDDHPGNYLAFFSSHAYAQQVADQLQAQRPDIPQWRQARSMTSAERSAFLARFTPQGSGIGFAVLGGVFGEGIDLPGKRLVGAFIATLAWPPIGPVQDHIRQRMDTLFGEGCGYADRLPALQKVVQAAGRVLRTPQDQGWLWLLDGRYLEPDITACLPAWWGLGHTFEASTSTET